MRSIVVALGIAALLVSGNISRGAEVNPPRPPAPIPLPAPTFGARDLSAFSLGADVSAFADAGTFDLAQLYRRLSSGIPAILLQPDIAAKKSQRDTLSALENPLGFTPAQRTLPADAGHILDLPTEDAAPMASVSQ